MGRVASIFFHCCIIRIAVAAIGFFGVVAGPSAIAATPAPLDAPNLKLLTNGQVYAVALQGDGGVVFGGAFSHVGGVPRANIARLAADGTLDAQWNPSIEGTVRSLAIDPASHAVFAGGTFRKVNAAERYNIVKLSGEGAGAEDPDWTPATNGTVYALAVDASAATLIAAGDFSSIGGTSRLFAAKLAMDGAGVVDAAWRPSFQNAVYALALDPGTRSLYAGGKFANVGGQSRTNLAKIALDGAGALDVTWNPSPNAPIRALAIDAGAAALYAAGEFTQIGTLARRYLAKLSTSGAGAPVGEWSADSNGYVFALSYDGRGRLYVGGQFAYIGNQPRANVARVSTATGAPDAQWNPQLDGDVRALAADANRSYAGGSFAHVDHVMRLGLAAFSDGTVPVLPDVELNASVHALAPLADGGLIVGGDFYKAGSIVRKHILRVQADGALDPDWNPAADATVRSLLADPAAGSVYVGGDFDTIGGQSRRRIARLSAGGSGDADPLWNPISEGPVLALAHDLTGQYVYVAGDFVDIGRQLRSRIAKLSVQGIGAAEPNWSPNANQTVNCLVVNPNDGSVFAGGLFSRIGGFARSGLAKLDGSGVGLADQDWAISMIGSPSSLALDTETNSLYVGGAITVLSNPMRNGVVKLSARPPATLDTQWTPKPAGSVFALAAVPGTRSLYVAGDFPRIGSQSRARLAKIAMDGDGSALPDWYPSADADGYALAVAPAGDAIIVGGAFTGVSGQPRNALASLPLSDPHGTNITVTLRSSVAGETVNFPIHVASIGGTPTGNVSITGNGYACSATLDANGDALCSILFPRAMNAPLSAAYAGDGIFAASSLLFDYGVGFANTILTIVDHSPNPSTAQDYVTFTVNLSAAPPSTGTPTGSILVSDGANACRIPQGETSCSVRLTTHGLRTVTATYDGDFNSYSGSTATAQHVVNRRPVAAGDAYAVNEDAVLAVDRAHGLLANDSDPDGDALAVAGAGLVDAAGIGGTVALAADGSFTYTPPPDAYGTATFEYGVNDGYEIVSATATITVSPVNDAPEFSLADSPTWPAGSNGPKTAPGFATVTRFGPANESDQHVAEWIVRAIDDPQAICSDVEVTRDGTLRYTLSGRSGTATFGIRLRDDGGAENGGQDTSAEQVFTITVAAAADLWVSIDDGHAFVPGSQRTAYTIVVGNAGPGDVSGARVLAPLPINLSGATWTCAASSGATCSPLGGGGIDDAVDLRSGARVTYELSADVLASPERPVEATVSVTGPKAMPDPDLTNNTAADSTQVGIYADGFD